MADVLSLTQDAEYRYVEFAARRQPGFRNCVIPLDRVPEHVRRYRGYGCYATVYLFREELREYARANRHRGHPSVAGFSGPVWAPKWPLDVDAENLDEAREAARSLYAHLVEVWELPSAAIRPYFSGKKGFHLVVDTGALGSPGPALDLPQTLRRLTRRLGREVARGREALDHAMGDRMRLLRLPGTRHEETGLFKVPLSAGELMELGVSEIVDLARQARSAPDRDPTGLLPWETVSPSVRARERFEAARLPPCPRFPPAPPARGREVLECPARRRLLGAGAPVGQRNNTAIRLASWLREGGLGAGEVERRLLAWNRRNPRALSEGEIRHVVDSAFSNPEPYSYGCGDFLIEPLCPRGAGNRRACPYHREEE